MLNPASQLQISADDQTSENIDVPEDTFVKETPPTLAPNSINIPTASPTPWRIQYDPTTSPSISYAPVVPKIRLEDRTDVDFGGICIALEPLNSKECCRIVVK